MILSHRTAVRIRVGMLKNSEELLGVFLCTVFATPHVSQRLQKSWHQTTYSQRILPSFLRRGITNLTIGSKRSVIPYPALVANP